MASLSDDELEYLSPSFDPASLTVPKIRAIFVSHDIPYPASAKKSQLIEIFNTQLVPKSRRILAARSRTTRTSRRIIDMPSSQESTVGGDSEDTETMPPPPVPATLKKKISTTRASTADRTEESVVSKRMSSGRKSAVKHPRASDTEGDPDAAPEQPVVRKSRKSNVTPTVKIEEPEKSVRRTSRPPLEASPFSDDNPFQRGSSPLLPEENRRRSGGTSTDRRKSSSRRRTIEARGSTETPVPKYQDGTVVPSSKTFEVPVTKTKTRKVKHEPEETVEAGEEFTAEEQLSLVRERAANGEHDILPPRRSNRSNRSTNVSRSALWIVLTTILTGYAAWYRKEKIEVGYCGIGKPSMNSELGELPAWTNILQPQCELCPQHAFCSADMEVSCDNNFVLKPHPLSLGGLIPLPPTCEPDGDRGRKIKAVADKAVTVLRERRAQWECSTLIENDGTPATAVEVPEPVLKAEVSAKRRKGMTDAEFEKLWEDAIGEILSREEVSDSHSREDGYALSLPTAPSPTPPIHYLPHHSLTHPLTNQLHPTPYRTRPHAHHPHPHRLASSSLARLPLLCALRRRTRLTLARYRLQLGLLAALGTLALYVRTRIRRHRADAARVPALVASTLDRLATQAALHARGAQPEPFISAGQMRDDVLREEFSLARRDALWSKVRFVVEMNANVRASVKEGRRGEISRVWEWIGSTMAEEERLELEGRDKEWRKGDGAGRYGYGRDALPAEEVVAGRRWDEGRSVV
ncbi:inner nuclear membrane protein enriched at telomere/subtelomere region [Xylographa parallela]|nr:inner nuclear membrane protein enriched at telomere/subtelomere region [Xylographa parallela]